MTRLRREIPGDPVEFVEILSEKMIKNLGRKEPPFQTEAFEYAALAGAKVIEADISSSGLMSVFNGRIIIEVNRNDRPERKNYTVCHEVGHIEVRRAAKVLPPLSKNGKIFRGKVENEGSSKEEERLVEQFAANLLMPKDIFRIKAEPLTPSLENAFVLAKMFRTSLGATLRRIISLGVWKCVIIWCIPEKMKGVDEWAVKIQEFRSSLAGLTCPRHKYVWWAGKQVEQAFHSESVVKDTVLIEEKNWKFEGLREWHYTPSGLRENRVMAILLPETSS